jgi:glycosyltransferase involved in cell wall biosynthesis
MGVCIMGDGPERATQTARASTLAIGDRVQWAGLVREAGRYFLGLDALVLSSRTEGVPMVILEAMSAGVPLVAPAVGGIPDVLTGREALLVPPERPDALAAAIRSVVEDRAAATARARAASERLARDFAEGPWLGSYDRVYDKACARVSASRRGRSPAR